MAQCDQVGLAGIDDDFGLRRIDDDADGHGANIGLAADLRGERHLEAIAVRVLIDAETAGRAVDDVDTDRFQGFGQGDAIVDGPATAAAIDRRQAHEQRLVLRPDGAHFAGDGQRQADAVLEAAAVFIAAVIGQR